MHPYTFYRRCYCVVTLEAERIFGIVFESQVPYFKTFARIGRAGLCLRKSETPAVYNTVVADTLYGDVLTVFCYCKIAVVAFAAAKLICLILGLVKVIPVPIKRNIRG